MLQNLYAATSAIIDRRQYDVIKGTRFESFSAPRQLKLPYTMKCVLTSTVDVNLNFEHAPLIKRLVGLWEGVGRYEELLLHQ